MYEETIEFLAIYLNNSDIFTKYVVYAASDPLAAGDPGLSARELETFFDKHPGKLLIVATVLIEVAMIILFYKLF